MENDPHTVLVRLAARVLTSCPVPTYAEDWHLPKHVSKRIQIKLDALDSWHKYIAAEIREAARAIKLHNK